MIHTLDTIPLGKKARIYGFKNDFLHEKMLEMGCLIGDEVIVLSKAPLGGPLFIEAGGSQLGIRVAEAKSIEIELVE